MEAANVSANQPPGPPGTRPVLAAPGGGGTTGAASRSLGVPHPTDAIDAAVACSRRERLKQPTIIRPCHAEQELGGEMVITTLDAPGVHGVSGCWPVLCVPASANIVVNADGRFGSDADRLRGAAFLRLAYNHLVLQAAKQGHHYLVPRSANKAMIVDRMVITGVCDRKGTLSPGKAGDHDASTKQAASGSAVQAVLARSKKANKHLHDAFLGRNLHERTKGETLSEPDLTFIVNNVHAPVWDHGRDVPHEINPIFAAMQGPGFGENFAGCIRFVRRMPQEFVHPLERTTRSLAEEHSRGRQAAGNSKKTLAAKATRAGGASGMFPLKKGELRAAIDRLKVDANGMARVHEALAFELPASVAASRREVGELGNGELALRCKAACIRALLHKCKQLDGDEGVVWDSHAVGLHIKPDEQHIRVTPDGMFSRTHAGNDADSVATTTFHLVRVVVVERGKKRLPNKITMSNLSRCHPEHVHAMQMQLGALSLEACADCHCIVVDRTDVVSCSLGQAPNFVTFVFEHDADYFARWQDYLSIAYAAAEETRSDWLALPVLVPDAASAGRSGVGAPHKTKRNAGCGCTLAVRLTHHDVRGKVFAKCSPVDYANVHWPQGLCVAVSAHGLHTHEPRTTVDSKTFGRARLSLEQRETMAQCSQSGASGFLMRQMLKEQGTVISAAQLAATLATETARKNGVIDAFLKDDAMLNRVYDVTVVRALRYLMGSPGMAVVIRYAEVDKQSASCSGADVKDAVQTEFKELWIPETLGGAGVLVNASHLHNDVGTPNTFCMADLLFQSVENAKAAAARFAHEGGPRHAVPDNVAVIVMSFAYVDVRTLRQSLCSMIDGQAALDYSCKTNAEGFSYAQVRLMTAERRIQLMLNAFVRNETASSHNFIFPIAIVLFYGPAAHCLTVTSTDDCFVERQSISPFLASINCDVGLCKFHAITLKVVEVYTSNMMQDGGMGKTFKSHLYKAVAADTPWVQSWMKRRLRAYINQDDPAPANKYRATPQVRAGENVHRNRQATLASLIDYVNTKQPYLCSVKESKSVAGTGNGYTGTESANKALKRNADGSRNNRVGTNRHILGAVRRTKETGDQRADDRQSVADNLAGKTTKIPYRENTRFVQDSLTSDRERKFLKECNAASRLKKVEAIRKDGHTLGFLVYDKPRREHAPGLPTPNYVRLVVLIETVVAGTSDVALSVWCPCKFFLDHGIGCSHVLWLLDFDIDLRDVTRQAHKSTHRGSDLAALWDAGFFSETHQKTRHTPTFRVHDPSKAAHRWASLPDATRCVTDTLTPPTNCPPGVSRALAVAKEWMTTTFNTDFGPCMINEDEGEAARARFKPAAAEERSAVASEPTQAYYAVRGMFQSAMNGCLALVQQEGNSTALLHHLRRTVVPFLAKDATALALNPEVQVRPTKHNSSQASRSRGDTRAPLTASRRVERTVGDADEWCSSAAGDSGDSDADADADADADLSRGAAKKCKEATPHVSREDPARQSIFATDRSPRGAHGDVFSPGKRARTDMDTGRSSQHDKEDVFTMVVDVQYFTCDLTAIRAAPATQRASGTEILQHYFGVVARDRDSNLPKRLTLADNMRPHAPLCGCDADDHWATCASTHCHTCLANAIHNDRCDPGDDRIGRAPANRREAYEHEAAYLPSLLSLLQGRAVVDATQLAGLDCPSLREFVINVLEQAPVVPSVASNAHIR